MHCDKRVFVMPSAKGVRCGAIQFIMSHYVKDAHGYDVKVPNQGQVNFNTVGAAGGIGWIAEKTGILGPGGVLNFGRGGGCVSPADMPVTRYELGMEQTIAAKDSEIALLKANTYQDQKMLELYKYVDGKFNDINANLAAQAVRNQGFTDAFRELSKDIDYKVNLEAERRECADCKIVNYANSTFAPKLITEFAAGTTSAAAQTYNPLACGQCCGGN